MRDLAVVTVCDPDDPGLAPYAAIRERDLVGRQRRFIVEGEVTLRLALSPHARFAIESVLLTPERYEGLRETLAALRDPPRVLVAEKAVMSAVAGFPIHRGVLAVGLRGDDPDPGSLVPPPPAPAVIVGLVALRNHDNVGAVFRNAAAFGADAVLLDCESCDPLYRKAIRVSAGAALTVPFARLSTAEAMLDLAARHALAPLALAPAAEHDISETALPARTLVLLGSEGPGLPTDLMARVPRRRIDMAPGFDSLNVATAGAIALHHLWRARLASRSGVRGESCLPQ